MAVPDESSRLHTAQAFLIHLGQEGAEVAIGLLSPSITYRVPGNHELAGVYSGKAEVEKHFKALVGATRGTFDLIQWQDWMVGTEHVSVLVHVKMQREGRILDGHFVILLRFDLDGKIDEIVVYPDDEGKLDFFFA